jgi:hypothetical protein
MENYSDLNQMFANDMSSLASTIMGMRESEATKMRELKLKSQEETNRHNAALNPLKEMYQTRQNEEIGARIPGVKADSTVKAVNGRITEAAEADTISANATKARLQKLDTFTSRLPEMTAYINQLPSVDTPAGNSRTLAVQKFAETMGITDHPMMGQLVQVPPENLPAALKAIHEHFALNSTKHLQTRDIEKEKAAAAAERTDALVAGRQQVAETQAAAKLAAQKSAAEAKMRGMNDQQRWNYLNGKPDKTEYEVAELDRLTRMRILAPVPGRDATGSELLGGKEVTTPAQRANTAVETILGSQPQKQAPAVPNIQEAVKKAGWSYEPDKYEYGINPKTGMFARRPKK